MNVTEAVASRRSVRAYLDKPVDEAVLRRVLEKARMTPSGYNFQPWEAVAVSGQPMQELAARMQAAEPQEPEEYQLVPKALPQLYKDRRNEIVARRMGAAGVAREDKAGAAALQARNYAFFGAPAALLVMVPRVMGPPQWSDVGMWLQTIMLLLREEGLDSCPQESLYIHGRLIKDFVGVSDETQIFFCGLAIGWRDPDAPLNNFERPRVPLEQSVRFVGF